MRRLLVVTAVLLTLIVAPAATAQAARLPDLQCGEVTTSVQLRHDLSCPNGVFVAGPELGFPDLPSHITIDLGGHTLTDSGPGAQCNGGGGRGCALAVTAEKTVVDVRDGTVAGGPLEYGATIGEVPAGTVSHVHVEGDAVFSGSVQALRDSVVDSVSFDGVSMVIDHNVILGGVFATDACESTCGPTVTITHNLIANAPGPGISFFLGFTRSDSARPFATITDNVIYRSAGDGIILDGFDHDLGRVVVARNWLVDNQGDGLLLHDTAPTSPEHPPSPPDVSTPLEIVRANVASGNAGHGFDLEPSPDYTIVDGGHNVAFANQTTPQCIGLACAP